MKIVQVMPEFGLAGAETMCENLTYELVKLGHQVIIISLFDYHSPITSRLENKGIKIIYLNKKHGLDLSMITKLALVFKDIKPDVVHTHRYVMQYTIPAAIFAGIKRRVHTVHNIAEKENSRIARIVNHFFYKFNRVTPVALSKIIKKSIIQEYNIQSKKIPVIFNGIDLSKCIIKDNYDYNCEFTFLHIGRFSEQKNHQTLIKAFYKVCKIKPDCVLKLIGEGEKIDEIKSLVEKLGLSKKVIFVGITDNVYHYMNESDAFVLPSLYEGIPMTLIEAMGTGLPIIATDVGGIPDMLKANEDAIITSPDTNEIADAMLKLCTDRGIRKYIGKNALKRSIVFSSTKMAQKYIEVYSK